MATFRKRGTKWRVEVRKQGIYLSATYSTKAEAREWAILKEAEISSGKIVIEEAMAERLLVRDAFTRYAKEVSPTKRGARWELIRLNALGRDPLSRVRLVDLKTQHTAKFRDARLKQVSPGTVNRDLNLISAVFTRARKEWGWLKVNPVHDLDRPRQPRPRDRLITEDEIDRIIMVLGYQEYSPIRTRRQLVGLFFLLAIETGMRLGEMCSMDDSSVHLAERYVQLDQTKNGDQRQVPLSSRAVELCTQFLQTALRIDSRVASTFFRQAVAKAEITNLHFHDTRHEAITRLSKKLDVLALARTVGHRDLKSLMVYYNESATSLAARLG